MQAGGVVLLPSLAAAAAADARAAVEAATGDGVPLAELRVRVGRVLRRRTSLAPQVANDAAATLLDAAVAAGHLARSGELVHVRGS